MLSPSMRREWIEMTHLFPLPGALLSPSMRREWIEMVVVTCVITVISMSPSMRREWIEIFVRIPTRTTTAVSLHAEGVD